MIIFYFKISNFDYSCIVFYSSCLDYCVIDYIIKGCIKRKDFSGIVYYRFLKNWCLNLRFVEWIMYKVVWYGGKNSGSCDCRSVVILYL